MLRVDEIEQEKVPEQQFAMAAKNSQYSLPVDATLKTMNHVQNIPGIEAVAFRNIYFADDQLPDSTIRRTGHQNIRPNQRGRGFDHGGRLGKIGRRL